MSSLDPENERVIEQTAHAHHGRVTILLVTQRLTSVRRADMIYVLDQGHLVEAGGWDELMGAADGRFHALCRAQGIHPTPATSPEFSTQSQEGAAHVH